MRIRTMIGSAIASAAILLMPGRGLHAQPQYVMNFGSVAPEGTPWSDQLEGIQQRVESDSNGRVRIRLFLSGALGSEIEMVRYVARGERLQGGGFSTGAISQALEIPLLSIPELPYLFQNVSEADAILDGVMLEPVQEALAEEGLVLGAWAENGWRSFATIGGPARSPAELSAFRMRCQENPIHVDMYEALGATPVAKPVSETLAALNTGIVNGFDNTPLFSLAAGWMGPVTHYTVSKHIYQPAGVVYSSAFMDSLPADLRTLVIGNPQAEAEQGRTAVRQLQRELMAAIRDMGTTVVRLDNSQKLAFLSATRVVHTNFINQNPSIATEYSMITEALAEIRGQ